MKLQTNTVVPGEWVIIEDGAPAPTNLAIQYVHFGNIRVPAYIDGRNLMFRCPEAKNSDTAIVSIRGLQLGTVKILR